MTVQTERIGRNVIRVWTWWALAIFIIQSGIPDMALAQSRWRSVHVQVAAGPEGHGGAGYSVIGEVGVSGSFQVSVQRISWYGISSCGLDDAPTEGDNAPVLWEVGGRFRFLSGERVAPFVGGGIGLYRRTWYQARGPFVRVLDNPKRSGSSTLSVAAGIDFEIHHPLSMRVSAIRQEVLDSDLEWIYGHRVSFTVLQVGLGYVVW